MRRLTTEQKKIPLPYVSKAGGRSFQKSVLDFIPPYGGIFLNDFLFEKTDVTAIPDYNMVNDINADNLAGVD